MSPQLRLTETEVLEQWRVTLENAENQPAIQAALAELGIGSEEITALEALLAQTRQAYETNRTEDDETLAAYTDWTAKREALTDLYMLHRKKAKVVFRKDAVTAEHLGITGRIPQSYIGWLEKVKVFYTVASGSEAIKTKLARLNIVANNLTDAQAKITALEAVRVLYLREKGESQDATKAKDAAFAKMEDKMSEFYAVARIALEDRPQLLESLGKFVRS